MDLGHLLNMVKGAAEYGAYIGIMHVADQAFGGNTPTAMALLYAPLGTYATADGLARVVFNSSLHGLPPEIIEETVEETVAPQPLPLPTANYSADSV